MFRLSRSARNSLLGLTAMLALFTSMNQNAEGDAPPASIPAGKKISSAKPAPPPARSSARRKDLLVGDKGLRGEIDLDKMKRVDDHFEAPLSDGSTAVLTIDPDVQAAVNQVLARAKANLGAIVVMRTDGRVLAIGGRSNQEPAREKNFDLALSVWAPAASVFKIITAAALVDAGVSPKSKVCYHGGFRSLDESNLVDNPRRDKTCKDLGFGVAKSQNALIAKLTHKHLNRKRLGAMAATFGLGSSTDFALDAEAGRVELPSDRLEFARVAAGFWSTELSALGGANVANVVATGGMKVQPRIVSEVREKERVVPVVAPVPERVLGEQVATAVGKMMAGSVDYGTAFKGFHDKRGRLFLGGTRVAGKTGSLSRDKPSYLGYSWFVGFAPADDPEVVISVLLGNPPKWHLKAHTAARLVLDSIY